MKEQKEIADAYRKMYDGMVKKDKKLLTEVLDDAFVLTHITGLKQDKSSFIKAIEDGTLNYYSVEHEDIKVNVNRNEAELTGKSIVVAKVFGGSKNTWHLLIQMKLVNRDNGWKIAHSKVSTY